MEFFTYKDLFATKGIEYILVLVFLGIFVIFSYLAVRSRESTQKMRTIVHGLFRTPDLLYYHQGHSWILPIGEKIAHVGIDDFAQKLIGKIDYLNLPKKGQNITQGEVGWSLVVDGKEIKMLSPIDGVVVKVNEEVVNNPEKIAHDPYEQGWLLRVYSPNLKSNLKNLLPSKLAKSWMDMLSENLLARTNYNLGYLMQDGGIPVHGIAKSLNPNNWEELVKEMLLTKDL